MIIVIILLAALAAISILCGIVLPTLKRKRCTASVEGIVSNRKSAGTSIGEGVDTEADRGTLTYFCNGRKYQKRIYVAPGATSVEIRVNPDKPEEFVHKSVRFYWLSVAMSAVVAVVAVLYLILICMNMNEIIK